jgi:hypothetical protein
MKSLIMMLFNTAKQTFHPILYLENPLPGGSDNNIVRLKSKLHHTSGFTSKEDAVNSINNELTPKVKEAFSLYSDLTIDTENIIEWNGEGIPADTQIVSK